MTLCTPGYLRELANSPIGNTTGHRDGLRDGADEIERLLAREALLHRVIQRQALGLMKIRTMQGDPVAIAREAMEPDDQQNGDKK